jgi:RHS repeat-associated protein
MTCRVEKGITYKQTYNTENRIASIAKLESGTCASPGNYVTKWDFAYDGDGTLAATLTTPYSSGVPQTAVLTAYYFGGAYEVTGSNVKKYYSFQGQSILRDSNGLQYLLSDHLGSTVSITDDNGTLTSEQRYLPFGGVRTIPNSMLEITDLGYTGQRDNSYIKLMDYDFRWYSPELARFISPDSIVPNLANPQSLNRFGYVLNNPIRYNDPTGHIPADCYDSDYCGSQKSTLLPDFKKNSKVGEILGDIGEHIFGDDFYSNPAYGGSSSGCNTYILWNGNNWCHHNIYVSPVCLPGVDCLPADEQNYSRRFQYPLQRPWLPIDPKEDRTYGFVMGGDFLANYDYDWARTIRARGSVYVTTDGSTMINSTLETHIFHQGDIRRTHIDGYIVTEGRGTNSTWVVAFTNQHLGPAAFKVFVDAPMLLYSTADQNSNGRLEQLMNMLP